MFRLDAVHRNQPTERRAVFAVVDLLKALGVLGRQLQMARDVMCHAFVDLGEQVAVGPIERVVEIEYPGIDAAEIRTRPGNNWHIFRWHNGNRRTNPAREIDR